MHASRSSSTARLIARCTLLATYDPARRPLVPAGSPALLRALLAADRGCTWFDLALRPAWSRALLRTLERLVLPGIVTHYLARKRWIEAATRAALAQGVQQVVVLGAGFDTLAWRLHSAHPSIRFFELDHPATQAPKQRALRPVTNLTLVPVDLAASSPAAALADCPSFSADRPTLYIAEGLLMYFPESRVIALLRELATLTRPPGRILLTFMEPAPGGELAFRGGHAVIGWWLRWRREPFHWGLARSALPDFLRRAGWRCAAIVDETILRTEILAAAGRASLPLARGECLCLGATAAS